MELKDKLQFLRKQNGYSQEQLADKPGIARQTIGRWENGRIDFFFAMCYNPLNN